VAATEVEWNMDDMQRGARDGGRGEHLPPAPGCCCSALAFGHIPWMAVMGDPAAFLPDTAAKANTRSPRATPQLEEIKTRCGQR